MKLAIIGSRNLIIEHLEDYLPDNVTEIVSGGAKGIDRLAAEYAKKHPLPLTEFLPDYARYGRGAPFIRNRQIAEYANEVLAFWNGISKGTMYTVRMFEKMGKQVTLIKKER